MAQLDPIAQKFIDDLTAKGGKPLYELTIPEARNLLESIQNTPVYKPDVDIMDIQVPGENFNISVFRPVGYKDKIMPCLMFFHGAGWILGSEHTHDRLVRIIATESVCAVAFVNYDRAPEKQYPVQIKQAYAATKYIAKCGSQFLLDGSNLAICGDSVGGNIAAVVTLMAKRKGFPKIKYQVLLYPVTDANFYNNSYREFANGPWLTKANMEWFWNAYLPDKSQRLLSTVSPLQASLEELSGLPPALIITDENDVLRDEGEAYAHKLIKAGVEVTASRYLGTHHDFMMLNALASSLAAISATDQVNRKLSEVFYSTTY